MFCGRAAEGGERGSHEKIREHSESDGRRDAEIPGGKDSRAGPRLPPFRQGPGPTCTGTRGRLAHSPPAP